MPFSQALDRATVVKSTALAMAAVLVFGLAMRVLVVGSADPIATIIGGVCAGLLYYIARLVERGASADSAAIAVMTVAILVYTIIAWTSHGYRGSIIFAAPMLPLVASLMLDKRGTRNVAVIVSAILLFILSQHMTGNIQVDESFPEHIRYSMRALVLLMSMVAVTWIAGYYKLSQGKPDSPVVADHTHDPLTGLLTRAVIDQALQRECARARRAGAWVSLALIEIDG